MSTWTSTNRDINATNYSGNGTPTVTIDIATTTTHNNIRLSVYDDYRAGITHTLDVTVLLTPTDATQLRDALTDALQRGTT